MKITYDLLREHLKLVKVTSPIGIKLITSRACNYYWEKGYILYIDGVCGGHKNMLVGGYRTHEDSINRIDDIKKNGLDMSGCFCTVELPSNYVLKEV